MAQFLVCGQEMAKQLQPRVDSAHSLKSEKHRIASVMNFLNRGDRGNDKSSSPQIVEQSKVAKLIHQKTKLTFY